MKRLTGTYGKGRSLREGPLRGWVPSQRRTTKRLAGRLGPYRKPLTKRDGPYGKGRSLWENPYGDGSLHLREGWALMGTPLRGVFTGRAGPYGRTLTGMGPFTEKDDEEAYGKAGPLREASYKRDGPYGPVLTGGSFTGMGPFTEKDDEEACGKAGPLRGAPYEKGRSLREGPVLMGEPLRGWVPSQRRTTKRLTGRLGPYGKPLTGRDGTYGKGRSLRENPYGDGSLHREGRRLLREGRTTKRLTGRLAYGAVLTGICPFTEKDDEEATGRDRPYGPLRDGWALTGRPLMRREGPLRGPLRERPSLTKTLHGRTFYGLTGDPYGVLCKLNYQGTQNPKS